MRGKPGPPTECAHARGQHLCSTYKGNAKKCGSLDRSAAIGPQRSELRIAFAEAADAADGHQALLIGSEAAIVRVVAHIQDRAPGVILRMRAGRRSASDRYGKGKSRQSHGNLLSARRRAG